MVLPLQHSFSPAKIGRASEDIALQIEAAILEEKILPGQKLPSEREMQNQFQCGRGVIREAIRALKQKGLVETRKGSKGGSYITEVDTSHIGESLAILLKQRHVQAESIIEFRESMDRIITILSVARGTKDEKERLLAGAEKLVKLADSPQTNDEEIAQQDRILNLLLAEMSKNPIFQWIMEAMQQGFSSYDYTLYSRLDYRRQFAANWQESALQIAANNPTKALLSISSHYALLNRCLAEQGSTNLPSHKE